ncbi:MAG: hypothetical protein ACOVOQ_11270 [Flavobacterium sp.]
MKIYTIEKVNLRKLYLYVFMGVLIYSLLMILLIRLITIFIPDFSYVNLVFVIVAIFFVNYSFNWAYSKSLKRIQIKLNDKKIVFEENEVLLIDLTRIKFRGLRFNYYPKLIIELVDKRKIKFRMTKNKDFDKFILALKTNSKTSSLLIFK